MIDLASPLVIESVRWDEGEALDIVIVTAGTRIETSWIVDTHSGMPVINPTPGTSLILGEPAVRLAGRTFVGPIAREFGAGADLDLPITLPCWWQGGGTPGWTDW